MPPMPRPKTRPAKARRPEPSTSGERESTSSESSSARSSSSRSRTPNRQVLQDQLARSYMMIGTMLMPFGRFYPVAGAIGTNMRDMSDEAASAWMDLAAKDKRVLEMLENAMSASAYGNIIGIHLAMFGSALPGVGGLVSGAANPPTQQQIIEAMWREGRQAGMTDEEIQAAIAEQFGGPVPMRDQGTGGPGDTIRTGGQPVAPVPDVPPVHAPSKAAIVSPEQLGVQVHGPDGTFPADASPPNGSGEISNATQ